MQKTKSEERIQPFFQIRKTGLRQLNVVQTPASTTHLHTPNNRYNHANI
jgi:hypothetical protein